MFNLRSYNNLLQTTEKLSDMLLESERENLALSLALAGTLPYVVEAKRAEALKAAWAKTRAKMQFTDWAYLRAFGFKANGVEFRVVPNAADRKKNGQVFYNDVTGDESGTTTTSTANCRVAFRLPVLGWQEVSGNLTHTETYDNASGLTNFTNTLDFSIAIDGGLDTFRLEVRSMAHELFGVCEHPGKVNLTRNPLWYEEVSKAWFGEEEFPAEIFNLS